MAPRRLDPDWELLSYGPSWNLLNDDLSGQSPETLRFLADLLRV